MKYISTRATRLKEILLAKVGLYLLFGLTLSILSFWVFWSVAEEVLEADTILLFDTALANQLHSQATPLSTSFYIAVSWLGYQAIVIAGIAFAVFYIFRHKWLNLIFGTITIAGGSLLNTAIKNVVMRPRPDFIDPFVIEYNYSFPSGHAMSSLIAYGLLTYLLWSATQNRYAKIFIIFGGTLLVLLIGISRLALGVHYFSDVVGGFAAGALWLGVCISALSFLKRQRI